MSLNMDFIFDTIILLICINIILILLVVSNKIRHEIIKNKRDKILELFSNENSRKNKAKLEGILAGDIKMFRELHSSLRMNIFKGARHEEIFKKIISTKKIEDRVIKNLKSFSKLKRIEAAVYLELSYSDKSRLAIENALIKEKSLLVKIYLINSLVAFKNKDSIKVIINTILNSPDWYRKKINPLICEYEGDFYEYFIENLKDTIQLEFIDLILEFSKKYAGSKLKDFLLSTFERGINEQGTLKIQAYKAIEVLFEMYYKELDVQEYFMSKDGYVRGLAYKSLSKEPSSNNFSKLIRFLEDTDEFAAQNAESTINNMILAKPKLIYAILDEFEKNENQQIRDCIANIVSKDIDFIFYRINTLNNSAIKSIVEKIVQAKKISGIVNFLNKNKNIEIENEILSILKDIIKKSDKDVEQVFYKYLDARISNKLGINMVGNEEVKKEHICNKKDLAYLYILLSVIVLIFPCLYIITHYKNLISFTIYEHLKMYVLDFNMYMVWYSLIVNGIYLLIMFFSYLGIAKQYRAWKIKNLTMLYKPQMLPSISIIAPAYNEEFTIIESINSLLHLKYPEYELIIVNDGSKDKTLSTIIDYFQLKKIDIPYKNFLNTKPVLGIYKNNSYKKLLVVDKINGGKADSLNVGINISTKDYFCGIDADSLLENDALLKISSSLIDSTKESIALGGNILPINGCKVDRGTLKSIAIPKNKIARLQTVEYLRAFISGRVGWSYINCLLIISGAFGLFKKQRVIDIGGYLTKSGKFKRDTVGEDMELVVRLSKYMKEKKIDFRIGYAFNANCWTEVPESIRILRNQRDRWHRGLIDVLTFHKNMILNPKYGRIGVVAFPYFFIFEMIGPLVEIQGYAMIFLAFLFGIMNLKIALLLFISTILLGTLISTSSLYLSEKEVNYFKIREILILILYAIVENFGPRQIISIWRVFGYFSALKKPKGWGKMERKGFSAS